MKSILFVCTGNIFRSMSAEYILKASLPAYQVSSAGTEGTAQPIADCVLRRLQSYGIDPSAHVSRRLSFDILDAADLVVAMGLDHQQHLQVFFNRTAPLFNEVCFGRSEPVLDIWEAVTDLTDYAAKVAYAESVVDYLRTAMPEFLKNAPRFMIRKTEQHQNLK